jgi:hypothetical protein
MDRQDVSFWLSIASFAMSTTLGLLRLLEFFGAKRIRIKANVSLISLPERGNTITLLNASSIPVTVSYYELVWVEKRKLFCISLPFTWREIGTDTPLDPSEGCNDTIAPHQTVTLLFSDEHHFDWGDGRPDTYLKLWFVGHKPMWIWITGPSKFRR